jgi:hypothetical protein
MLRRCHADKKIVAGATNKHITKLREVAVCGELTFPIPGSLFQTEIPLRNSHCVIPVHPPRAPTES